MMHELFYGLLPDELDTLTNLARIPWTNVYVPHGVIHPALRVGPGWFHLPALFIDAGKSLCITVKGFELQDRNEIFRLAIEVSTKNAECFDSSKYTGGIHSISQIAIPQDLALSSFIGERSNVFLLRAKEKWQAPMLVQPMTLDICCDSGLYIVNDRARLLVLLDEMPYSLKLTTQDNLIDATLKSISSFHLIV